MVAEKFEAVAWSAKEYDKIQSQDLCRREGAWYEFHHMFQEMRMLFGVAL